MVGGGSRQTPQHGPKARPAVTCTLTCVFLAGTLWLAGPSAQQQQPPPPPAGQSGGSPVGTPGQQDPGAVQPSAPPDPSQQQQEQPVFRTGINFVRVDVIVTDKQGNPVMDLKAEDFSVAEDDKPQTIETFKLVKVTGSPEPGEAAPPPIRSDYDEEREAQRDDVRIFVIMLDDYHVRLGSSLGVREPLVKFVQNQLGPLDMVGLMYPLSPVTEIRLTRNHDALVRAIQRFEGRKFDYRPRNEFEEKYSMYPAEIVERVRNEVSLSALRALVTHLGSVREGRKAVILVSEGYSNYLPPQLRDPVAEMPGVGNPNRGRGMLGENSMAEDRTRFFADIDINTQMRDVFSAANRSNTSIYALDPRGLAVFEYGVDEAVGLRTDNTMLNQTMDTLRVLADETDGRAIVNRNDLEGGLKQVIRDNSVYYLLGYNSTQAPTDGKFHAVKVRVKRPGVEVRARKGYWALTAEDTARALSPSSKAGPDPGITNALASVEAPSRARSVRTWIGTAPGENGKTRISFVWEPVPPVPGTRQELPARVSVIAAGQETYFRGKVEPQIATDSGGSGTTASARTSLFTNRSARAEFDAPPGRMQMRVSVEGAAGQVIDTDMLDVEVPDYTAPQIRLSTPQVIRARSAVEFRALNTNPEAIPSAGREFSRTERLLIRFSATGPGSERPTTSARLLNRAGQAMSDLPTTPVAGADGRLQVDLPLAGLPTGEYIVEVKSSAGAGEAKQFVGFRIVS